MKTLEVITKENKDVKIRFNENTNKVHSSDYIKLNDGNFEEGMIGDGFTDYKVGNSIVRKTYPTWLEEGRCNIM